MEHFDVGCSVANDSLHKAMVTISTKSIISLIKINSLKILAQIKIFARNLPEMVLNVIDSDLNDLLLSICHLLLQVKYEP